MRAAEREIHTPREREFGDLLADSAVLSHTLIEMRGRLSERLTRLDGLGHDLEGAVARAREAMARGRACDSEVERLRAVHRRMRQELGGVPA